LIADKIELFLQIHANTIQTYNNNSDSDSDHQNNDEDKEPGAKMNYYSDEIINDMIDSTDISELADNIHTFREEIHMLFIYFTFPKINLDYINCILEDEKNKIVFRSIDNNHFDIRNCPSAMIYTKKIDIHKKECVYYILMICTKSNFKRFGYASSMLDDFIKKIQINKKDGFTTKIILNSLENAVSYYEKYGFIDTMDTLFDHPVLLRYEKPSDDEPMYIMQFSV